MSVNNFFRVLQRFAARYALYFFIFIFKRISYPAAKRVFSFMAGSGVMTTPKHRRNARDNIRMTLGRTKPKEETDLILKKCFYNTSWSFLELVYMGFHQELVGPSAVIEGQEHLQAALKEGRGAIVVTAHFGNFPLMLMRLAQEYPVNIIIRHTRDHILEKEWNQIRYDRGIKTIYSLPQNECVSKSLKVLRNNELLFVPLDQNYGAKGGVYVDFLGHKAATATGPVVFSMRTGAPLIPIFIRRLSQDKHVIMIQPPFHIEEKPTQQETIVYNVQKATSIIEEQVLASPHEWSWMHRRWKSRPREESMEKTNASV